MGEEDATVVALYGATAGQVSLVASRMTTNQAVCALAPKPHYRYFNYLFLSTSKDILAGMASGSAQQNLSKGLVEEVATFDCGEVLMAQFDEISKALFGKIIASERENRTLAETRDYLLPKLMSGEVRVRESYKFAEALGQ